LTTGMKKVSNHIIVCIRTIGVAVMLAGCIFLFDSLFLVLILPVSHVLKHTVVSSGLVSLIALKISTLCAIGLVSMLAGVFFVKSLRTSLLLAITIYVLYLWSSLMHLHVLRANFLDEQFLGKGFVITSLLNLITLACEGRSKIAAGGGLKIRKILTK